MAAIGEDQGARRRLPDALMPAVMVGTIAGLDNIGSGLAIASLLFAGPLVSGLGLGVGVVLLGAAVLAFYVALRSTQPNSVALVQETAVAILAGAMAEMALRLEAPAEAKVATGLAILGVSSLVTGGLFWITGRMRLGKLMRFLPFPVVAGFLAGSGWLLVSGAMFVLTGHGAGLAFIETLTRPEILVRVCAAIAFAAVLITALRRSSHPATTPVVMVAGVAAFYATLFATGFDMEAARALGQLPEAPSGGGMSLPTPDLLPLVDWPSVAAAAPSILSVAMLSVIGLLLNVSGLELANSRDIDVDAELRSTGIANLLSGSFGGPSGFTGLSMSVLAEKMGAKGRGAGFATAAIMLVGVFVAGPLISHVPIFLTAGFLLFLGTELLLEWLVATRRQLPLIEWLIIVAILAAIAMVGFMEGLAVGVMVSIVVFVINYSRLPVVRSSASGTDQRSSVDRSPAAMRILADHGDAIEVVQLQGYLFFGTADRMVDHLRRRLAETDRAPLRFLVLDFRHVSGADSAAMTCFVKMKGMIGTDGVTVSFTHVPPEIETALRQAGLAFDDAGPMMLEPDIDHALERAEEALLGDDPELDADAGLMIHLTAAVGPHPRMADFIAAMTRLEMAPGDVLITAGEEADEVFFVASGRVRVQITLPNGRTLRLRTMTGGAVVGEIALYLHQKRTADVIVETPSEIFRLRAEDLARLEREDSEVAILAHRILASNLSEKLSMANRMIQLAQR